ncbi:MAG TPA: hypothetical protein VGG90_08825 [Candidatus Dormibacteraeota bacterium]
MRHPTGETDPSVWPSTLPARARWLPYSPEPRHGADVSFDAPPPPPTPQPRPMPRSSPARFGRLLLMSAAGAGLVGVGGGMLAGFIFGAH